MQIWAVANQKGGVGKTTTAVTLAGWLALRGKRTLMIDIDPHGSTTAYFGFDPDNAVGSVYSLFAQRPGGAETPVHATRFERLSLMPASTALATLDRQLGPRDGMGRILIEALARVRDDFDYALIDCPPMLGVLMVNALAACSRLVIPVQSEFLAIKGLERMMRTIKMVTKARASGFSYTVVPCMFDRRLGVAHRSLELLRGRYAGVLWESVIPIDSKFREASQLGLPLPMLNPKSRGAVAYAELLDWLTPPVAQAPASLAL